MPVYRFTSLSSIPEDGSWSSSSRLLDSSSLLQAGGHQPPPDYINDRLQAEEQEQRPLEQCMIETNQISNAREGKANMKMHNKIHSVMRAIDDQKRIKEEMEEKEKKQLKKQLKLTQLQIDLKELEDQLE